MRFEISRYFLTELSWTVSVRFPPQARHFPRSGIRRYFSPHFVQRTCWLENAFRFPIRSGRKWWTTIRATTSFGSTARIRSASSSCLSIFSAIEPSPYADASGPCATSVVSCVNENPSYCRTLPIRLLTVSICGSISFGCAKRSAASYSEVGYAGMTSRLWASLSISFGSMRDVRTSGASISPPRLSGRNAREKLTRQSRSRITESSSPSQLDSLIVMLQEAAAAVPRVPEPSGGLDRDAHFVWREVRERQVRHVEPGRAVLEHIDVVLRTEDAFLDRLGRLRPRDHPLDGLDLRRFRLAHPFERGPQDVGQGDALPRRPVPGDRVAAARTLREEPPLAARSADPP